MSRLRILSGACLAGLVATAVFAAGPDVIVGELHGTRHWTTGGPVNEGGVDYRAYSIATTSCNIGTMRLDWVQESNQHPVIPQNMYRLKDGRLMQIGMSWLKHGFCALQETACGPCQPAGFGCENELGIGCSDPYSADLNGSQGNLGPRYEVNAYTGYFVWPFAFRNVTGNAIYKRLRVAQADLGNPGALYFVEAMYIHPDDAAYGNQANNASYRRVTVSGSYSLTLQGTTVRQDPAIKAWRAHGNGVNNPDVNVTLVPVDVPNEGRYWLAYKVTDLGTGTWRYQYAVQNLTSDRSGGSFSVPAVNVQTSNPFFHSPRYHSGEPYDNSPWVLEVGGGVIRWRSPQDFLTNPNTNALRWGTMYNFEFDANTPPVMGEVTLGLFKFGTPGSVQIAALVPQQGSGCAGDVDGDGDVDQADLGALLANFGQQVPPGTGGDLDGDGDVDQSDLGVLLGDFGCS